MGEGPAPESRLPPGRPPPRKDPPLDLGPPGEDRKLVLLFLDVEVTDELLPLLAASLLVISCCCRSCLCLSASGICPSKREADAGAVLSGFRLAGLSSPETHPVGGW